MPPLGCWPPVRLGLIGARAFSSRWQTTAGTAPDLSGTGRPAAKQEGALSCTASFATRAGSVRTWQLRIASARLCLANPGHMAPTPICKKEVEKNQSLMEQAHIEAIAALRSRREAFSLASLDSAPSISEQISPSLSGQKIPSLTTTAKRDVAPCFMSMPTSSSAR